MTQTTGAATVKQQQPSATAAKLRRERAQESCRGSNTTLSCHARRSAALTAATALKHYG